VKLRAPVPVCHALLCQSMSPDGHPRYDLSPDFGAIVVGSFEMPFAHRFDSHSHPVHQLAWSERGVLAVSVGARTWVLPPTRALWIPGGVVHAVEASSPATMRSVYFRRRACPIRWTAPTVVAVGPLLRELIRHLALGQPRPRAVAHARALLYELITPLSVAAIDLPRPLDPRALRVVDLLTRDPADRRDLTALGRHAGASARTLARLFLAETGLSFGAWRLQLRLRAALLHLAAGQPVATVSRQVGYESTSAFVAAFRRHIGVTPGLYFATTDTPP
jgi:AraC-like DNA-binding protein